jgi:SNF2 family DNA or RNA helicase
MYSRFEVRKVLIIAPLTVANVTWPDEFRKWMDFAHFEYEVLTGSVTQRTKKLYSNAPIHIINRENIVWLVTALRGVWPYELVMIDEISSFKSREAQRWTALAAASKAFTRVVGLTGTPAPNGLIDLWPQMYLIDGGQRLGKNITAYRSRWFVGGEYNKWHIKPDSKEQIYEAIGDVCMSMSAEDYLTVPPVTEIDYPVPFTETQKAEYKKFEKESVLKLIEAETTITAANAAALMSKLLQYSSGALYHSATAQGAPQTWAHIHDAKIDALADIIEAAQGEPVLVFYDFRHSLERIARRWPRAVVVTEKDAVRRWNAGEIQLLLAHPASAGHGLNLQNGGHIAVFFGLPWSLELYQQACARLHRQGQQNPVQIYRLLSQGTRDNYVATRLKGKAEVQFDLLEAVKTILAEYLIK